jgi:hypothetical protein
LSLGPFISSSSPTAAIFSFTRLFALFAKLMAFVAFLNS